MNFLFFLTFFSFSWGKEHHHHHQNIHDHHSFTHLEKAEAKRFESFKQVINQSLEGLDDFTRSDCNLIKFLRAKEFHVNQAANLFNKHLRWRRINKVDGILEEDWSDMAKEFPVYQDGIDKHGRPVFYASIGQEWDISEANRQGKLDRFLRWAGIKAFDHMTRLACGMNQTQFIFLGNLEGFSVSKHLCGAELCLDVYKNYFQMYEDNYPETIHKAYMVNAPLAFDQVLSAIYPVMSTSTKKNFQVFGEEKEEWEPAVFAVIEKDQLNEDVGGTRQRGTGNAEGRTQIPEPEIQGSIGVKIAITRLLNIDLIFWGLLVFLMPKLQGFLA